MRTRIAAGERKSKEIFAFHHGRCLSWVMHMAYRRGTSGNILSSIRGSMILRHGDSEFNGRHRSRVTVPFNVNGLDRSEYLD